MQHDERFHLGYSSFDLSSLYLASTHHVLMTSPSTAAQALLPVMAPVPTEKSSKLSKADTLPVSTTSTSASAALARSLFLFLGEQGSMYNSNADSAGLMFRRPSKLFRPSRGTLPDVS